MDENVVSMMVLGGVVLGVAYLFFTTRHRERMKLYDKLIESPTAFPKDFFRADSLKFGLMAIGIAIGSFIGYLFSKNDIMDKEIAYTAFVFLFGGIGLVTSYFLLRRMQ